MLVVLFLNKAGKLFVGLSLFFLNKSNETIDKFKRIRNYRDIPWFIWGIKLWQLGATISLGLGGALLGVSRWLHRIFLQP